MWYNYSAAGRRVFLRKEIFFMDNYQARVLVVDDESDIRRIIRLLLTAKGYSVFEAKNGAEAVESVKENAPDLVIMDIMMPVMNGVEATAEMRKFSTVPILFLTAKSLDRDKGEAYGSGGDDYVVKPFYSAELIMKIESMLRRYMVYKGKEDGSVGDIHILELPCNIEINTEDRSVYKNGEQVILREREADILFFLLEHSGEILETNAIYEQVWGEMALPSSANNVMVNMLNLRRKLEDDPSNPKIIRTVWGRGYQLVTR